MLNLAYLASSHIPGKAANTVHVLNMSAAFAAYCTNVVLLAQGDATVREQVFRDFALDHRFELALLPLTNPRILNRLRFIHHVRRTVARSSVDIAYGRSIYGLLAGVPGKIPVACDLHSWPDSPWRVRLEGLLFRRPNFLFATAITRALADKYASAYPHIRDKIVVAPCAAKIPDAAAVPPGERHSGPPRIYYVGHLYRGRGIDLILSLAELEPDLEFHLVGGEESDVRFWSHHAPPNVTFHGYVKPRELFAHYSRADVCLAPHSGAVQVSGGCGDISEWMSPMKIFEYMAHRKPIIASDIPVIREIINADVDGILCRADDLQAWRRAIHALKDDSGLRERLGSAAFEKVQHGYTWEQRARAILAEARERTDGRSSEG